MMDARRGQVYAGIYEMREERLVTVKEQSAIDVHDLLKELGNYPMKVHFLGDGVPVYQDVLCAETSNEYHITPPHLSRQRGAAVAVLGEVYYRQGKTETPAQHRPVYLRKSQAEREREERLNAN
jgi:tRNA A37 threonylcarbamoyladenosine modification protein TsaB